MDLASTRWSTNVLPVVSVRVPMAAVNTATKSNLGRKGLISAYSSGHGPTTQESQGRNSGEKPGFILCMDVLSACM